LSGANNIAYWAHAQVTKKMKCCEQAIRCLQVTGTFELTRVKPLYDAPI